MIGFRQQFVIEDRHSYASLLRSVGTDLKVMQELLQPFSFRSTLDVARRRLQCAGINRHEAEDERALRERSSDPLGPESCTPHRESP